MSFLASIPVEQKALVNSTGKEVVTVASPRSRYKTYVLGSTAPRMEIRRCFCSSTEATVFIDTELDLVIAEKYVAV